MFLPRANFLTKTAKALLLRYRRPTLAPVAADGGQWDLHEGFGDQPMRTPEPVPTEYAPIAAAPVGQTFRMDPARIGAGAVSRPRRVPVHEPETRKNARCPGPRKPQWRRQAVAHRKIRGRILAAAAAVGARRRSEARPGRPRAGISYRGRSIHRAAACGALEDRNPAGVP